MINIASILGLVGGGDPGRPATIAYNTSKGGVVNFTRSLAAEWAQYIFITGPGSPSVLTNVVVAIEQHVDWISGCMKHLRATDVERIEAEIGYENRWVKHKARMIKDESAIHRDMRV